MSEEKRDVGVSATFMVSKQFLSDILTGMAETCPHMCSWFGDEKTNIKRVEDGRGDKTWLEPLSVLSITGTYDLKEGNEGDRGGKTTICLASVQLALCRVCVYDDLSSDIRGRILRALIDNDCGHIDSEASDVLAQLAIFGEVIYG